MNKHTVQTLLESLLHEALTVRLSGVNLSRIKARQAQILIDYIPILLVPPIDITPVKPSTKNVYFYGVLNL